PGGWAESLTAPADAVAQIPDALDFADAAPFGCAGVATFNAVRRAGVSPGGRVAVFGLGGLGHLAIQFAARLGYETTAIARGGDRAGAAHLLGAHHYLDSTDGKPGAALATAGGADLIVYCASATEPMAELMTGLRARGSLALLGVDAAALTIPVADLVTHERTIVGHLTGSPREIEEAMRCAVTTGVRPVCESVSFDEADWLGSTGALARLRAGTARYRMLLRAD
ncbi:MAG: zinc-binding dehydrogenase, partial [Nocardioides sp.]